MALANNQNALGGGSPMPVAAPTPPPVVRDAPDPTDPTLGAGYPINTGSPIPQPRDIGYTGPVASPPGDQNQNMFSSDPGYAAALAAEQLGLGSVNSNLNNLVAQRIAAYGDPALAAQAGFGLDPQAAAFARQNYLAGNAELARIDKSHQQARTAIINRLAGHGLLDSGDTGYQTGQEDQGYGNNVYDAQQRVLADILGYRNDALNQTNSLHGAVTSALENAYQNALSHPELFGYGQAQAPPPPPTSTTTPSVRPSALSSIAAIARHLAGQPRGRVVFG